MKIAIVGSGISGLTTAHHLGPHHDVTLFEANSYLGGHANTVDIEIAGRRYAIDTGFIVYNDRTYPNFCRLIDQLEVASQPTSMTFSVRCDQTGLEYRGADLNGLFAQRRNLVRPSFYRLLRGFLRFSRQFQHDELRLDESVTVGDFFRAHRYSREFVEQYFLPMGSAIWSCPQGVFEEFPLQFIVDFYRHHGLLSVRDRPQWRVIQGGSQNYVAAILKRFSGTVRTHCPVQSVRRDDCGVIVHTGGDWQRFDHVVFACHSDQALRILGPQATAVERDVLSAIPYQRNEAVLHTDSSVLPRSRRAWASWNYRLPGEPAAKATVTYNMNILQSIRSRHDFCVTLNGQHQIDPTRVLGRYVYHHPVFTTARAAAQRRHVELLNANRTSFCGAYWSNGFHEDGVRSALAVCEAIRNAPVSTAPTNTVSHTRPLTPN